MPLPSSNSCNSKNAPLGAFLLGVLGDRGVPSTIGIYDAGNVRKAQVDCPAFQSTQHGCGSDGLPRGAVSRRGPTFAAALFTLQ